MCLCFKGSVLSPPAHCPFSCWMCAPTLAKTRSSRGAWGAKSFLGGSFQRSRYRNCSFPRFNEGLVCSLPCTHSSLPASVLAPRCLRGDFTCTFAFISRQRCIRPWDLSVVCAYLIALRLIGRTSPHFVQCSFHSFPRRS